MKIHLVFVLVSILPFVFGEIAELQTLEALKTFKEGNVPVGIFYYTYSSSQPFRSRTLKMMKELDEEYDNPYVLLGVVNCMLPGILEAKLEECSKSRRIFYMYKMTGPVSQQEFSVQELFSLLSLEAQILSFVYNDKVDIVQDQKDNQYLIESSIGEKDIILFYTNGFGTEDHYKFLRYVGANVDKYYFAISTEHKFMTETFSSNIDDNFGLVYISSKKAKDATSCQYRHFSGKHFPTETVWKGFIDSVDKPLIEKISKDGSIFQSDSVHLFYLIVDNDNDVTKLSQICVNVIANIPNEEALLRCVLVDVREFNNLGMFGVLTKDMLPTFAIQRQNTKFIDSYPPDQEVNENNVIEFVENVVNKLDDFVKKMADVYDIQSITSKAYQINKKATDDSDTEYMIASCTDNVGYDCRNFQIVFRRFTRTLQVNSLHDIEFMYVDYTDDIRGLEMNLPKIQFISSGKNHEKKLKNEDNVYEKLLQWFSEIYRLHVVPLPMSSVDQYSLSVSSLQQKDVNSEDIDEDLAGFQDDEIRRDVVNMDAIIYKDNVTMLTDETFNKTVAENALLVVLFYVPYDSPSKVLQIVFSNIQKALLTQGKDKVQTKIAKVDCYSDFKACKYMELVNYPTIKIFKNGHFVSTYRGLLDKESLIQTIRLYQNPSLISLTRDTIDSFEKELEPTIPYADVVFVGRFPQENQDFQTYSKISQMYYGKYLFGYIIDGDISKLPRGQEFPLISSFNRKDELMKPRIMSGNFNEENLQQFVQKSQIPTLGLMKIGNFPLYRVQGLPIVSLFTNEQRRLESDEWKSLVVAAKENTGDALFVWMDTDDEVIKRVRRAYLGSRSIKQTNDIVLVNHTKGDVYLYDMSKHSDKSVTQWIKDCAGGLTHKISTLSHQKWKPLREGFDFLHFIDNNIGGNHGQEVNDVSYQNPRLHHAADTHRKEEEEDEIVYESAGGININGLPESEQENEIDDGIDADTSEVTNNDNRDEDEESLDADEVASKQYFHDEF